MRRYAKDPKKYKRGRKIDDKDYSKFTPMNYKKIILSKLLTYFVSKVLLFITFFYLLNVDKLYTFKTSILS